MDPQPKKEYQYKTLESRQIRLVYLHPSNRETINCTIEHVSIDENPTFEALSYTWGTAMERFIINVGSASLSVGKNLAVALRALVSSDEPRAIWIDAICINQNDALERNHQVRFMKDIYTRARSVLVWLGEAADGSDAVMDYVGSLDPTSALTEHRAYVDYNDTWTWEKGDPFQRPPVPQGDVDALLCRPWFSRVWIQQEAAVNAVTKVTCGSKCVTWNQLFSLVWSYQKPSGTGFAKDAFHIDAMASSILIMMIQSYRYDDIETLLLDILRDCTYCGATDPRDRIYGVQNLAKDPDLDKLLLEPSYDISVPAVYTDLAKRFLTSQDTFILSWAGRSNQRSRDLPSWVPDWTMKNTEIPSIIFRAAGDVKSDCKLGIHDGKEALHVSGLTVSSISSLTDGPAMTAFRSRLDEVEVFQQLRENFEACITLVKNISIGTCTAARLDWKALWRTLAIDSTRSWTRLGDTYSDALVEFPEWLRSDRDRAPPDIPSSYLEYLEILNLRCIFTFRRFATDSKGNMCIVPRSAKTGDFIVVIAGLSLPLVIRSVEKGLEIIGECYVHGQMDGEVVEGVERHEWQQFTFF